MLKRRFSVILTALLLLSMLLTACQGSDQGGSTTNNNSPDNGQSAAPTAAATSEAAGLSGSDQSTPATNDTGNTSGNAGGAADNGAMVEKLDFGGFGGGSNPQLNYNPYSPNALTADYTFEPLYIFNSYSCDGVPWLATKYEWSDPQTLVYTIRDGVKWNDGQPFSADDVVFTYNLLQKNKAIDTNGIWETIDNVSSSGNQFTVKFKAPASNMLQKVSNVKIVPRHIWEKESDPVKFTNESAVGTGPFKPTSFNGQQLVLTRNDTYWQADKIRVKQLVFHNNQGGGQVDQLNLSQGKFDTNAMFVPNIKQVYVDKDPTHNHYWYPPGGEIGLGFNLTKEPFSDPEFRRGVAYGIDRQSISDKAEYGYVKAASQTGLVLPGQKDWLSSDVKDQGMIPYDPKMAADILDKAGYKKDSSGKLLDKNGKPIEFTFLVQNGWTDWIQAGQIVQQDLQKLGMTVNLQTPAPDNVENERALGNFDLVFAVHGGSCSMYENFHDMFYSKQSAPVGQKAATNFIRWQDPETDKLIDQIRQSPDESAQKQAVQGLEKIMMDKFPTVPLWYGAHWFQYSTKHAEGWPNEQDPYAGPTDGLLIMTHLKPTGQ